MAATAEENKRLTDDAADKGDKITEPLTLNIVLLGDGGTGKTSIAMRFASNTFPSGYKQTVGLDFYQKKLTLTNDLSVNIKLWDVAGQTIISNRRAANYLYSANAVILVYDITHVGSFQNLEEWLKLIHKTYLDEIDPVALDTRDPRLPFMALVGNKSDLTSIRTVKNERHNVFAAVNNLPSFLVSSKTGEGITACLQQITSDLLGVSKAKAEGEGPPAKTTQFAKTLQSLQAPAITNLSVIAPKGQDNTLRQGFSLFKKS
ncbi:Ras- protein Rab-28 [Blyttiomyces sp. JEL0837]|nr:Ras- protein Rab-28 [Blyttiomyces sp. JEL0837]